MAPVQRDAEPERFPPDASRCDNVDGGMPRSVRGAVLGLLVLALAASLYLLSVRGYALLLDLGGAAGRWLCF